METSVDDFFRGFPLANAAADKNAMTVLRGLASVWAPPPAAQVLSENRDMHQSIGWALRAAATDSVLRVWHERKAADCVEGASVRPDFTLTGSRDAAPSTIGALVQVEVKLPGDVEKGARQMRAYLRRRVFRLCCEADARGEPIDEIFSLGAATDGHWVVLVRVDSGAPAAGATYASLMPTPQPCPSRQTPALELFGPWNFVTPPPWKKAGARAPPALCALRRLLAAPAQCLGGGLALESLRVALHDDAAQGGREEVLTLGERLGCGGTSDVYELAGGSGGAVVKVSRVATAAVVAGFAAERAALGAMGPAAAEAELVPTCVAFGERVAGAAASHAAAAVPWPVLILRPQGTPLAAWVAERVAAAEASAGPAAAAVAAAAARRAAADAIFPRVLDSLSAAHVAGYVHCDVRPANIVVAGRGAVLVDWGIARQLGAPLKCSGVEDFCDSRIWQVGGVSARPHHDALGALYTWIAVAFGSGGAAPWAAGEFAARQAWIAARARTDAGVANVAIGVAALEAMTGRSPASAALLAARRCFAEGGGD